MLKFIFSLVVTMAHAENVVVLGDSLTASVFGGTKSVMIKDVDYVKREGSLLRKLVLWAVEDRHDSWGTGSVDYSIVSRLESRGNTVNAFNTAISGATVYDIVKSEIPNVEKWKKAKKIDLTMVFIGANDLCAPSIHQMTSLNDFKNYYLVVAEYVRQSTRKVFIPLPDITSLYKQKDNKCMFGIKCKKIWGITKSCTNVMSGKNLPLIQERIRGYNKIIKEEATRVGGIYVENADMLEFESKHISRVDGFHADSKGQKLIADLVWEKLNE